MLQELYYGNSLQQWAIAFGFVILFIVVGRIIYWIFKKVIHQLTRRTETRLDDILLDMIEEPITLILVAFGIRYAIETLTLSEEVIVIIEYSFWFIITLSVTWMIARVYDALHEEYLIPLADKTKTDLDDHLFPVLRKIIRVAVWSLGILVALNNAGFNVTAVLAGLGVGGLAFALAVQHTFGNMVAGVIIYLDRHVKVGDRIQVKGTLQNIDGVVQEIGFRNTKVKTRYEGRIVNIPNMMLTTQDVVNVDSEDGRQLFAVYKLTPDTSADKVEKMIEILDQAVKSTEGTKELVVTGLVKVSEIGSEIMLLYWVEDEFSKVKTRNKINLKILRAAQEEQIQFTSNSQVRYNLDIEF